MRKTTTALLGTLLGALWTATTLAAATFTVVRLTNQTGCSREPSISANGKRIAFASEADLVPPGNVDANFEIFLRDQKKGLTQITTTTGGENRSPKITRNGARIAFLSDRDLVTGGNADANLEVFLFDKKTGIRQVTSTTGCSSQNPVASASGAQIAFASSCDLVSGSNADGSFEVFLFDHKKGFTQISNGSNVSPADDFSSAPAISNGGTRVAFTSNADLVAGGNADENDEIFLFDKKKGLRQITTTTGCFSGAPAVSASATRIAFTSSCDLVPGSNAGGVKQVFLFDVKKGFSQITHAPAPPGPAQDVIPALDAGGKRIAFLSNADLVTGGNTDLNFELFLFIPKTGLLQLSTSTGGQNGVQGGPALSANGKHIVFESTTELTAGSNPDGEGEIYLVNQN